MKNQKMDQTILFKFTKGKKLKNFTKNALKSLTEKEIKYLKNRFPKDEFVDLATIIKRIFYGYEKVPTCNTCGKKLIRYSQIRNKIRFCSEYCSWHNPEVLKKYKATCNKKYGSDTPFGSKIIKKKIKKNVLEKYGVKNVAQLDFVKEKTKQTCMERYGVSHQWKNEEIKRKTQETLKNRTEKQKQKTRQKRKRTMKKKYGVTNNLIRPEIKIKSHNDIANEKRKQTSLKNWGTEHPLKSKLIVNKVINTKKLKSEEDPKYQKNITKKIQKTMLKKFGYICNLNMPEIKKKAHNKKSMEKCFETKKKNGTFNTSKSEDKVYEILTSIFGIKDVLRNYKDKKRYPFHCDFYIKSLDLFIECNFHWTHGGHWFNKNNKEDLKELNKILKLSKKKSYYNCKIDVWTKRDLKKKKIASKNKINYLVFWSFKEFEEYITKHRLRKQ